MLTINVRVPETHDRTAAVEVVSGYSKIATDIAAASALPDLAARNGNAECDPMRPYGHPPVGTYRLLTHAPAPEGCEIEYGKHFLVFEPESGDALEAESFGRLLLLAYAGPSGKDGNLRRTQGGIRLKQATLDTILARLQADPDARLSIRPLRAPAWWQFWKRSEETFPLSSDPPRLIAPPLDEASLAARLAEGMRLSLRSRLPRDDDRDATSRGSSSRSESGQGATYSGKGGESGGAGASGSWDDASRSAGGSRGVDAAGRILPAAAAGAAVLAGMAEAGAGTGSAGPSGTETITSY